MPRPAARHTLVGLLHRHGGEVRDAMRPYAWSPVTTVLDLLGLAPAHRHGSSFPLNRLTMSESAASITHSCEIWLAVYLEYFCNTLDGPSSDTQPKRDRWQLGNPLHLQRPADFVGWRLYTPNPWAVLPYMSV